MSRRVRGHRNTHDEPDGVEMLDIPHEYIHAHNIVQRSASGADSAVEVLAHLSGLRLDITRADDAAVDVTSGHSRNENHPATSGSDHPVGKVPTGSAQLVRVELLFHE
jgi:hypothetical protein